MSENDTSRDWSEEQFSLLLDELASIEQERWAHWQRYIHSSGKRQSDGSLTLPADLVDRWERQIQTRYSDLSPEEKESDREQVRRYFPLLRQWLSNQANKDERSA